MIGRYWKQPIDKMFNRLRRLNSPADMGNIEAKRPYSKTEGLRCSRDGIITADSGL